MRIAIPNKGSFHEPTLQRLRKAGIDPNRRSNRELYARAIDQEITVLYARESDIPEYLTAGHCDVGVTTQTHVRESEADLVKLLDLAFGREQAVLTVPTEQYPCTIDDLAGKTVATEFPTIARNYFAPKVLDVNILEVSGAAELTPSVGMSDAILETTGRLGTKKMNELAIVDELFESSVHLFAPDQTAQNPAVEKVVTALQAVLNANGTRYVMMNVPTERLNDVKAVLPCLDGPTVMDIAGRDAVAVHAVIEESETFEITDNLQQNGATDILITTVTQLVR